MKAETAKITLLEYMQLAYWEVEMLSDRRQLVLHALIEEYVSKALPVGSKTLFDNYDLGCSSATIRNELSRLEDEGYLTQPHTSAGRIPTDMGYRVFVDELLAHWGGDVGKLPLEELKSTAQELDELIERTSMALTRLTDCLALVVPPRALALHVKMVDLVQLSPQRLILVAVSPEGEVFDRTVDLPEPKDAESIARAQEKLNNLVGSHYLERNHDPDALDAEIASDPLFALLVHELSACLTSQRRRRPYQLGMANLMTQPEFSASASLLPLLSKLEDDTILLKVYDDAVSQEGPIVRIGHENGTEELNGVSVVASHFGEGDSRGVVAILGPTRMNYSQVIAAVHAAKKALGGW